MLKLNSTGGKLDITITDDVIFGTSKKPAIKPQKGRVASRAANPHGRQQNKPTTSQAAGPKGRESRQAKAIKKGPALKQNKPPARQEKRTVRSQVEAKATLSKGNAAQGSSVITQAKLDNILSMLNNGQSGGGESSLSPEQLSVLVTSLSKMKSAEPQVQQEVLPQSKPNDIQRNNKSDAHLNKTNLNENEHPIKINNQVEDDKARWRKELDEQVISKRKAKELEKQKERAAEEYNPWGRPGAGAPIRSQSGKVLADYHNRTIQESVEKPTHESTVFPSHVSAIPSQSRPSPVATVGSTTSNVDTALPVALRSSFAVGAPGLVSNETQQKRLQELKWKQELEKQIEEKKESERQRKQKEEQEDLLNISWNNKHTRAPPRQDTLPSQVANTTNNAHQQKEYTERKPENTATQGTHDDSGSFLNQSLNGSFNRSSHARGFGMHTMDPQSQDEAEKKRLKMLEHQRAIQEQVEENRRRKQQEREHRLKEEAIEEARLAKERENLNQAFAIEQKRKREKEEEAKRVSDALQQSVLDAYESAQQAKREKRQRQLGAGSHNVRGGASSRSYVVSRTSSLAHHGLHGEDVGVSHDRQSILSNYATPRGHETPRNKPHGRVSKAGQSRTLANEPFVPPLDLIRGESPPVPTLRNKLPRHAKPSSHRSATPPSVRDFNPQRIVSSSHSEPAGGSLALSTRKDTQRSQAADILTSLDELSSARFQPDEPPFDTIEDAFMIPYHRTDSATLPAPPDTPEDTTPTVAKPIKTKGSNVKKNIKSSPVKDGSTLTPMYRSQSIHLKPGKPDAVVSPRRTKGAKPAAKPALSPRGVVKRSLKDSTNTKPRTKPAANVDKKQVSPRIDAALSRLSRHQEIPEVLTTARQEMILHQLAALRQGLIQKERELKQGLQP